MVTHLDDEVSQRAIGVYLDTKGELAVDWEEIAAIIEGVRRLRAPKALVARLDKQRPAALSKSERAGPTQ